MGRKAVPKISEKQIVKVIQLINWKNCKKKEQKKAEKNGRKMDINDSKNCAKKRLKKLIKKRDRKMGEKKRFENEAKKSSWKSG